MEIAEREITPAGCCRPGTKLQPNCGNPHLAALVNRDPMLIDCQRFRFSLSLALSALAKC